MKKVEVKRSIYEATSFKESRDKIKDDVIASYLEHYSFKKVSTIFGIHPKTVARIIKENGIEFKGRGEASQLVKNNPFDYNTVEDKSYWLGFIAGDGYISRDKNLVKITSIDLELIEQFEYFVGKGIARGQKMIKNGIIYTASFSHQSAKDYLVKRGITTNKSKTLKFKVRLNWDIIRGLFDADGSFAQNRLKITTASKELINQLTTFYNENGIEVKVQDKGTGECWDIYLLGGKETIAFVYSKFYSHNPTYYLARKREQIGRYIR